MRKFLCLLLALAMTLAMMACGTETDSTDVGTSDPGTSEAVLDATESTADPTESSADPTETAADPTESTAETGEATTGEDTTEESQEATQAATEETDTEPSETEPSETEPPTQNEEETEAPTQNEEETEAPTQTPHDTEVDYSEAIIGTWAVDVQMVTAESLGLTGLESELILTLLMSFDDAGNAVLWVDMEKAAQMVADFEADLVAYMVDMMYKELASQGFSESAADDQFYAAYAMTILDYCQQAVADMNLAESLNAESLRDEDTYSLEGNALYVGSNVMMIEIDGDVLYILSDDHNAWRNLGFQYPVTMNRAE